MNVKPQITKAMKFIFFILLLFVSVFSVNAQTDTIRTEDEPVFDVVEVQPEFPGGNEALFKFIADNIVYPASAKEEGIQGKVYVQFVIDKDGNVTKPQIVRGVNSLLDREALRVINLMPKWKPGYQSGKPVNVKYVIPIMFKLKE